MFKRTTLLTGAFLLTFGFAGLAFSDTAEARHRGRCGGAPVYSSYHAGYGPTYYGRSYGPRYGGGFYRGGGGFYGGRTWGSGFYGGGWGSGYRGGIGPGVFIGF